MSLLSRLAKIAAEKGAEKLAVRKGAKTAERAAEDLAVRPRAPTLAAKPKAPPKPKALPAPKKVLALPKPGPGLPEYAAKPKGGQWWTDRDFSGANFSPENAVRRLMPPSLAHSQEPEDAALREWWARAVPRYIKSDLASPDDPLRDIAARGLLHIPDTDAEGWSKLAAGSFIDDPIERVLFGARTAPGAMPGAGDNFRGEIMAAMPWLAKAPVTDKVYGVNPTSLGGLDFTHIADEMRNALAPDVTGIPADLAVRPESLARMSFPQAVERVGRINQWRAKQAGQTALSNLSSPAIHTFKEYAEDNPMGLRWVELKAPELDPDLDPRAYKDLHGDWPDTPEQALQDALKYEGDTMGHCVGGYCDGVLSGRSRIFSLRDAKGEPHVTIETGKGHIDQPHRLVPEEVQQQIDAELMARGTLNYGREFERELRNWVAQNVELPENIVQIKGKQNRAPKDDYLPFVQDFVKSQQWGNIGDLGNTGLVKLPDGRYITQAQLDEGLQRHFGEVDDTKRSYFRRYAAEPAEWEQYAPHFQGYAVGGKVDADRCFCHNPLSVRRG